MPQWQVNVCVWIRRPVESHSHRAVRGNQRKSAIHVWALNKNHHPAHSMWHQPWNKGKSALWYVRTQHVTWHGHLLRLLSSLNRKRKRGSPTGTTFVSAHSEEETSWLLPPCNSLTKQKLQESSVCSNEHNKTQEPVKLLVKLYTTGEL